jgi:vancomycin resistance protein YoaR
MAVVTGWAAPGDPTPVILIDDGTISLGVHINSFDVGGLNRGQAQALLQSESAKDALGKAKLVLVLPKRTIEISVDEFSAVAQTDAAIDRAMRIGRAGGIDERMQSIENARIGGTDIGVSYAYDETKLFDILQAIISKIPRSSKPGNFVFDPNLVERFVIEQGHIGFLVDEQGLMARTKEALSSGKLQGVVVPGSQAQDGGVEVLKDGTKENTVLISKFTTIVAGSQSRVSNIRTGARLLNGKVVVPGEVFSVNDTLGPRTKEAGVWRPAGAVLNGRHTTEYGGGLCQVSTTLFNAAVRADLLIVEWVHHTIPSTYVGIGCDATVSTGGPDVKFKNNTDWPVYIVFNYETGSKKLICEMWGRPLPDGQTIGLIGYQVGTKKMPAAIFTDDKKLLREGRIGKYSETYKVWYAADGAEIRRELIDKHLYPALAPIQLKPAATPFAGPSPTSNTAPDA